MRQRWIEISVGFFIILGIAALAVLALQVSGLTLQPQQGSYKLYANFNDVGGLAVRGQVSMAGVRIGKVASIQLDPKTYQARVELAIDQSVDNLPVDSVAVVRTAGLLGEKYIDVSVGGDEEFLKPGEAFTGTQSALNIEKLISSFAAGR